jgi:hypothetical protein
MPSISTFKNIVAGDARPLSGGRLRPPDGTISPLHFDQTVVEQVFRRLRDLLNAVDYEGMRPLLHDRITWKMIHNSDSFTGIDEVVQWLKKGKTSLEPQFIPDLDKSQKTVLTGDGSVLISGPATWKPDSAKEATETIKYYLTFTSGGGRWFLSHALAVPLSPDQDKTPLEEILRVLARLQERLNQAKYKEMQPDLDPNITWKMIHHADSIKGAFRVTKWLEDSKVVLKPQFKLSDVQVVAKNGDGTYRVSGRAEWRASERSPTEKPEKIEYHFTFLKSGDSWLLNNAFATVVDVKVDPPPSKG